MSVRNDKDRGALSHSRLQSTAESMVIAAMVMLSATGCSAQTEESRDIGRLPMVSVPFSIQSGLKQKAAYVVYDANRWQEAWLSLNSNRRPVPPLPDVDFDQSMVVVVAAGTQKSGGYAIEIVGSEVVSGILRVHVIETRPGPGCIVTNGLTAPVDIGVLLRTSVNVEFDIRVSELDCD